MTEFEQIEEILSKHEALKYWIFGTCYAKLLNKMPV